MANRRYHSLQPTGRRHVAPSTELRYANATTNLRDDGLYSSTPVFSPSSRSPRQQQLQYRDQPTSNSSTALSSYRSQNSTNSNRDFPESTRVLSPERSLAAMQQARNAEVLARRSSSQVPEQRRSAKRSSAGSSSINSKTPSYRSRTPSPPKTSSGISRTRDQFRDRDRLSSSNIGSRSSTRGLKGALTSPTQHGQLRDQDRIRPASTTASRPASADVMHLLEKTLSDMETMQQHAKRLESQNKQLKQQVQATAEESHRQLEAKDQRIVKLKEEIQQLRLQQQATRAASSSARSSLRPASRPPSHDASEDREETEPDQATQSSRTQYGFLFG
eukprot:m.143190 g.143190  ORF g.143190 m.143190 type:complete len:332 (+) comp16171_c0_seq47:63-1058(+)